MTDWVIPVATPTPEGGGGILSAAYPRAPATCSACSSAAPRSGLVSTYSGTTSRSSPGNTTRCTTRRPLPTSAVSLSRESVTSLPQAAERLAAGEERAEAIFVHGQRRPDRHVHVEVLVC